MPPRSMLRGQKLGGASNKQPDNVELTNVTLPADREACSIYWEDPRVAGRKRKKCDGLTNKTKRYVGKTWQAWIPSAACTRR